MTYSSAKKLLYSFIFLYLIVAAIILIVSPQRIGWDAGLCIKMTDNAYKHIPFNHYAHPRPGNINEDESEFVAWWSPGQFAIPLFIIKCFGIKVSTALKILTMLCILISTSGIFKLFGQLIPDKNSITRDGPPMSIIVLLLVVFTIMQPFFWETLYVYDGGGILPYATIKA